MSARGFRRFIVGISFVILFSGLAGGGAARATICYVNVNVGGGTNAGTSWGNAYTDLQSALLNSSCTEIWVAKGVYKPDGANSGDQTLSFVIEPNVAVYGGFAGTESVRSERNPVANVTVLSGDIDNNDSVDADGVDKSYTDISGNNSYRVADFDTSSVLAGPSTVLDGFTITGGDDASGNGAGLTCATGPAPCSPTLADLTFSGNRAAGGGAIWLNADSPPATVAPTLTDVTFSGNHAIVSGGAVFDSAANPQTGVGPSFTNVTFTGNSAGNSGGAVENEAIDYGVVNPAFFSVTFSANHAANSGGAIDGYTASQGTSSPAFTNVILWGDYLTSGSNGPEIFNNGTTPTISYSVVEGSGGSTSWDTTLGTDGGGNLDANPRLGPLQLNGGSTETMALLAGSSAIDTGDDGSCPATDQRGVTRPQDGNGDGSAICDIGAYEALPTVTAIPTLSPWALLLLALGLVLVTCRHMTIREVDLETGDSRTILEPYGPTGHES